MRYAPLPAALALPALGGCAPSSPAPTLESYRGAAPACCDRTRGPQAAAVDSRLHFRPFGGAAPPFDKAVRYPEDTSRILRRLDDAAFRNAALGENCFRPLDPDYRAPPICAAAG